MITHAKVPSRQPDGPERYAGRVEAMAAASEHCRRQWEVHGTPFGIRVRDRQGEWIDVLFHGGKHPMLGPSLA